MEYRYNVQNGGRFISRGKGAHVSRVIRSWELIFVLKSELYMYVGKDDYTVSAGRCILRHYLFSGFILKLLIQKRRNILSRYHDVFP